MAPVNEVKKTSVYMIMSTCFYMRQDLNSVWQHLHALPRDAESLLVVSTSIHSLLRASTRNSIRTPHLVTTSRQVAISARETSSTRNATITAQRTTNNSALALRRSERESGILARGGKGRASTGRVPSSLADDATLLRAVEHDVEVALTAEGCAWGRGGGRCRSTRSCGCGGCRSTATLGQVLDTCLRARRFRAIGVGSDELTGLQWTANVVVVPNLVQDTTLAAESDLNTRAVHSQCRLNRRESVCLAGAGLDASSLEPLVTGQSLEQVDGFLEVVDNLFGSLVVAVAVGLECANTCAVLGPLVLPEGLVVALIVFPVRGHVGEEVVCAKRGQDGGNVGVGARGIAVGIVCAIASIRPGNVNEWWNILAS
jgi:hypothetical protein